LTPADMAPAQTSLVAWCDRKIATLTVERGELETNLLALTERGMKGFAIAAVLRRTERTLLYYEKLRAAVEAGYLIVPNFPIDVFAVRVKRQKQPETVRDSHWGGFTATAQLLPAGEGRYVDEQVQYRDESYVEKIDGKEKHVRRYVSDDYDAVDFPFTIVKPAVLAATQHAMALRIFDEMGTVQNQRRRGDPIVVGRLIDPRSRGHYATFFVAWWLDTRTL
jgi:hypothetical protein